MKFQALLNAMPGKTCEVTVGCEAEVSWAADMHGCDQLTVCAEHAKVWLYEVHEAISSSGAAICPDCGERFTVVTNLVNFRKI